MKTPEITVTEWKAAAVLAGIVVFALVRSQAVKETLPTEGAEELRMHLANEYMAAGLPALAQAVGVNDSGAVEDLTERLLSRERVSVTEFDARGTFHDVLVRAVIQVDGEPPSIGEPVRYFRMHFSPTVGWMVDYETHALSYYLKLF